MGGWVGARQGVWGGSCGAGAEAGVGRGLRRGRGEWGGSGWLAAALLHKGACVRGGPCMHSHSSALQQRSIGLLRCERGAAQHSLHAPCMLPPVHTHTHTLALSLMGTARSHPTHESGMQSSWRSYLPAGARGRQAAGEAGRGGRRGGRCGGRWAEAGVGAVVGRRARRAGGGCRQEAGPASWLASGRPTGKSQRAGNRTRQASKRGSRWQGREARGAGEDRHGKKAWQGGGRRLTCSQRCHESKVKRLTQLLEAGLQSFLLERRGGRKARHRHEEGEREVRAAREEGGSSTSDARQACTCCAPQGRGPARRGRSTQHGRPLSRPPRRRSRQTDRIWCPLAEGWQRRLRRRRRLPCRSPPCRRRRRV